MNLKQIKDYWPLLLGLITLISFLVSLKIDSEYSKMRLDEVVAILKEGSVQLADHEIRLTLLEAK